jgi:D-glycero-alpha-D-manno-heptose-7-phosphate kinase
MKTIAASAPARVSLAGGGTDLPAYSDRFGGAVVSFALDRHATAEVSPRTDGLELLAPDHDAREFIAAASAQRRLRPPILAEEHLLFQKAAASHFRLDRATISAYSEVPIGAGLASSGSLAVALAAAVGAMLGDPHDPTRIAEAAFRMEADLLGRPCGRQDQYASAFGGINLIEFSVDGSLVTPLRVDTAALADRILLFTDGSKRDAAVPLRDQHARTTADDPSTLAALHELRGAAYQMRRLLEDGDFDGAGWLLHETWLRKVKINDTMRNPRIAEAVVHARAAGALGAKLAGAGGSGTLLVFAAEGSADSIRIELAGLGWKDLGCRVSQTGVTTRTITDPEEGRVG